MYIEKDNLTIRNASAEDAPVLGKWWRDGKVMEHAGFPNGLQVTDEEIVEKILYDSDETHRLLMLEINGKTVGEMNYRNMGEGIAQIGIKICDYSHQGKGYGTKLLLMLISELFQKKDYSSIVLDTNLKNLRAQHVYEKIGFKRVKVNYDSWKNQLGELQSSVEYELEKKDFSNKNNDIPEDQS